MTNKTGIITFIFFFWSCVLFLNAQHHDSNTQKSFENYNKLIDFFSGDSVRYNQDGVLLEGWKEDLYSDGKVKHKGFYHKGKLLLFRNFYENAMGLITDAKGDYAILSDILGDEDHLGDMDFKVCGTKDGITAVQMDLKVNGLPYEVMAKAMEQAKQGRLHIMNEMLKAIDTPRTDYKPHAPRFEKIVIAGEFIGAVIGPGGKVIQEMQKSTNTTIVISEEGKNGIVEIFGTNLADVNAAKARVKAIVSVPEIGDIYQAKVKTIMPYGAFVEIMPGKDGLLHISEYDWKRIDTLEGLLKEGDVIEVKYVGDDPKTKKIKLSRKVLLPKPEGMTEKAERPEKNEA